MAGTMSTSLRRRKAFADALAGLAASLIALWMFYPLDVIKTNLQAGIPLQKWHLRDLLVGLEHKSLHCASSSFCYFYLYSFIFSWWRQRQGADSKLSAITRLTLSAVAAMLNTMLTLPLDVVSSQRQTSFYYSAEEEEETEEDDEEEDEVEVFYDATEEENNTKANDKKESAAESRRVMRKRSSQDFPRPRLQAYKSFTSFSSYQDIAPFWKGLVPSLLLCSNPSIHYTVFDMLKSSILDRRSLTNESLSLTEAFLLGLIAKLTATLATYPLIRAKILLMVTHRRSMLGVLVHEYKRHGIFQGWYRGCNLQLAHTILKSALLMMVRERIAARTHTLLLPKRQA